MNTLTKIIMGLISIIGVIASFKTLAPENLTYESLFNSAVGVSGWIFAVIVVFAIIIREEQHNKKLADSESKLADVSEDKRFLQNELSKTTISLNHLTGSINRDARPIPRSVRPKNEGTDEF